MEQNPYVKMFCSAAATGRVNWLQLLGNDRDTKKFYDTPNAQGATPLFLAAQEGQWKAVEFLVSQHEVNPKTVHQLICPDGSITPCTVLHIAAAKGHKRVVEALIHHSDINSQEAPNRWTPLHYATIGGHVEIIATLLSKNADIYAQDTREDSPILLAYYHSDPRVFEEFQKQLPLFTAIRSERLDHAQELIFAKLDLERRDGNFWNRTALLYAIATGTQKMVQLLIDAGANLHAMNCKGEDALSYAKVWGRFDITEIIKKALNKEAKGKA